MVQVNAFTDYPTVCGSTLAIRWDKGSQTKTDLPLARACACNLFVEHLLGVRFGSQRG